MKLVCVVAVAVHLLWCCENVRGVEDDIYNCEIFQPANFNISIGEYELSSVSLENHVFLKYSRMLFSL